MKLSFVFLILAAAGCALAADKPDFSGNWKMDVNKSDFGGSPPPESFTRKIEQAEPSLILTDEQTSPLAGHEKVVRTYTTDAKVTTYEWMGSEVKSAAHWEGNELVIVGKVDASGTEVVVTSRLTLSADGKTLTENDQITAGGNPVGELKLVLIKQ